MVHTILHLSCGDQLCRSSLSSFQIANQGSPDSNVLHHQYSSSIPRHQSKKFFSPLSGFDLIVTTMLFILWNKLGWQLSVNFTQLHIKVHEFPLHFDPNITSLVWGFSEGIRSQFIEPPDSRLPSLKLQPPSDIFQPFLAQPTSLIVSCKRNVNMTNICTKQIQLTNLSSQISLPLLKDVKFSSVAWYARNLFPAPVAPLELCTLALTIPHQSINRAWPHAAFSTR